MWDRWTSGGGGRGFAGWHRTQARAREPGYPRHTDAPRFQRIDGKDPGWWWWWWWWCYLRWGWAAPGTGQVSGLRLEPPPFVAPPPQVPPPLCTADRFRAPRGLAGLILQSPISNSQSPSLPRLLRQASLLASLFPVGQYIHDSTSPPRNPPSVANHEAVECHFPQAESWDNVLHDPLSPRSPNKTALPFHKKMATAHPNERHTIVVRRKHHGNI